MIRQAESRDIESIIKIYEIARQYMKDHGNPNQWKESYPSKELILEDIRNEQLYVCEQDNTIYGVFAFILGEDETYQYIEDGAWKNDKPYGTIHRIASDGTVKGVLYESVEFCKEKIGNIRIDTHEDNKTMQYLLEKYGFEYCGRIYLKDKSPRIAYQYEAV